MVWTAHCARGRCRPCLPFHTSWSPFCLTPTNPPPPAPQTGILAADPFESIDQRGVGELVRIAAERGRAARPGIELGICGEHGGDPASVEFFHRAGLDYVSCSPLRVPIARLAAAQAALRASPPAKAS